MAPTVKPELVSPAKRQCLNAALQKPKVEQASTPNRHAAPAGEAAAVSPGPAAPADKQTPQAARQSSKKPVGWNSKLKATPGKFVMNLSTPTPPRDRGTKRPPTALEHPAPRHARPPPPLPETHAPPPGSGCSIPAEPAEPSGDTGGTGSSSKPARAATRCTSEAKRIHNAFDFQRKHFHKEPALQQHFDDLIEAHTKGSPIILELKRAIGECKGGKFDTPVLLAIKKRIRIKEWGKTAELGSWKMVLDRLGPVVAYAALRQGTLPYPRIVCFYLGTG